MNAKQEQRIILTDSSGFWWTGHDFKWPSCDSRPQFFTPEEALKTAFALATKYQDQLELEEGCIELNKYDPMSDKFERFLSTDSAKNWPRAKSAFNFHIGVELDREQYLKWRDKPEF